jgi:hypothetical protein
MPELALLSRHRRLSREITDGKTGTTSRLGSAALKRSPDEVVWINHLGGTAFSIFNESALKVGEKN